ncbi:hypothetical protein SPHINGOR109_70018 [Sphingorhabdus sp. 109]|jgi:hypothetical protein|nr:hypothetical protein SPHINGOR109_70018 [Sphingorhabdus sp. 109]|tara:strand:- start:3444 stop:3614 length:171 start_codon:yes stop_codon:yes gene_type:complete
MEIQRSSYSNTEFGIQKIHYNLSPKHRQFMTVPEPIYKRENLRGLAEQPPPDGLFT